MKILTIIGARPQFVKAGVLSREIQKQKTKGLQINEIIVHTGQHFDKKMSHIFFEELHLPQPNYNLGINNLNHGAMTGQMMEKIEKISIKEQPEIILVYGDTNSTLAGALVGAKLHIPVAHVEAGLRSFNMKMPEEINRVLTDRLSKWLFCPTQNAIENLKKEGFPFKYFDNKNQIIKNVGDVMYDAVLFYKQYAKPPKIYNNYEFKFQDFILCTIHRAENTNNHRKLKKIFEALEDIAKETQIILPLHPRTKKIIQKLKLQTKNLKIIEPVSYLEMLWLLDKCNLVITDSGGLQKEAFFFKKYCITLREETEWIELVKIGVNILVGADKEKIKNAIKNFSKLKIRNLKFNLYGNGNAGEKILNELLN